MTHSQLANPLSAEELDQLEAFLLSEATPEDCMDLEMLDGFLACIVSGPEAIPPSQWLPRVWSSEAAEPTFETPGQAQRILELMMRHMNGIARILLDSPSDFAPVLYEADDEEEGLPLAARWSLGYLTAMELGGDTWKPLTAQEERAEALMPILALAADADDPDFGLGARDIETRLQLVEMLSAAVGVIHGFWLARRSGWTLPHRNPGKAGRNDPCPCGSGKTYKQCCGAKGTG